MQLLAPWRRYTRVAGDAPAMRRRHANAPSSSSQTARLDGMDVPSASFASQGGAHARRGASPYQDNPSVRHASGIKQQPLHRCAAAISPCRCFSLKLFYLQQLSIIQQPHTGLQQRTRRPISGCLSQLHGQQPTMPGGCDSSRRRSKLQNVSATAASSQ